MMKHTLIPLLLGLVLLCGCAAQNPPDSAVALSADEVDSAPDSGGLRIALLEDTGTVRRFSFSEKVTGFLPLGDNLLFFSDTEPTVMTLLEPSSGQISAVHEPGFTLTAENATVQLLDRGISYFNGNTNETVVLDKSLQELRRIRTPEDLTGMPLLSHDGGTLYYCTASAIRAMNLEDRISRVLKESSYPVQSLTALLLDDTVLQVSITDTDGQWRTLFLSGRNGQLLHEAEGNLLPQTGNERYLLQQNNTIFFGQLQGRTMVLHPRRQDADCFLLPGSYQAVTATAENGHMLLELYDLERGCRTAQAALPGLFSLKNITQDHQGCIWFLASQDTPVLYSWNPDTSELSDNTCYTAPFYTSENPDYDGLARCALYAQELSSKYGIEILVYRDAAAKEPWDYHLTYEHRADRLYRELEKLDRNLRVLPEGFLKTLADRFTALKICIVQSIEGSPESGNTDPVNGIQFMDGFDAYIVLAAEYDTAYSLYHELSHLIETVVLTESTAYDRWELLNPEDFAYDNNYTANRSRDGSRWLQPGKEYFIDTYAMSYAKEDRARLFEYSMTDGHTARFASPNLQAKLRQLCTGIREGFGLEKFQNKLPWEQYLQTPLHSTE